MTKVEELKATLDTLEVEIAATKKQRDRALAAYDEAARDQDRQGAKDHGERLDECEAHLKELREKRIEIEKDLSFARFLGPHSAEEVIDLLIKYGHKHGISDELINGLREVRKEKHKDTDSN